MSEFHEPINDNVDSSPNVSSPINNPYLEEENIYEHIQEQKFNIPDFKTHQDALFKKLNAQYKTIDTKTENDKTIDAEDIKVALTKKLPSKQKRTNSIYNLVST